MSMGFGMGTRILGSGSECIGLSRLLFGTKFGVDLRSSGDDQWSDLA